MNFKEIKLTEGQKYTVVFYDGLTGITTAPITLVDYYVSDYAQYKECLYLEVKIGRQRTIRELIFTPNQPILIIEGVQKISFDSLYTIEEKNGITHKQSKVLSQSNKWLECAYEEVNKENVIFYSLENKKLNA